MSDAYDSPWKEMLELYFEEFMAFFFPDIHAQIDWSQGYESCDQELPKRVRAAEAKSRIVDKLIRVTRLDGEPRLVYVHGEVQGDFDPDFPLRVFTANYRLFDRYQVPIASLAVLTDDRYPQWRPSSYSHDLWGCEVSLRFPIVKLSDYNDKWSMLEGDKNPFAVVVMAHLKTQATRHDPEDRLIWKIRLVRDLYERGFEQREVVELFRFIDWLFALPPELEERFEDDLQRFQAEKKMRYVTTIERKAIQRGREQGLQQGIERGVEQGMERGIQQGMERGIQQGMERGVQQGQAAILGRQLERRFGELPRKLSERLRRASPAELERWADRVIDAPTLDEIFKRGG